jgi:putative restriction endonuclease
MVDATRQKALRTFQPSSMRFRLQHPSSSIQNTRVTKAVFTTKPSPAYDDLPEIRYHFPKAYLSQASEAVGDSIVYYEPRRPSADPASRGGRQSYFAVARVSRIETDSNLSGHYYAYVDDYLDFDRPVPFRDSGRYYESGLQRADGKTSKGAFGRAIRTIPDQEFAQILGAGFASGLADYTASAGRSGLEEVPSLEDGTATRAIIQTTLMRPFREEAFRRQVRLAYDNRCAISGLRLINGGGRPEVHAAHIKPVASMGPDSVRNGIALSGTLHWMFDRGLISVDDEFRILRSTGLPDDASRLIRPESTLLPPTDVTLRPHPSFLRFHRERVFKG